jgi:hypothetical protein
MHPRQRLENGGQKSVLLSDHQYELCDGARTDDRLAVPWRIGLAGSMRMAGQPYLPGAADGRGDEVVCQDQKTVLSRSWRRQNRPRHER